MRPVIIFAGTTEGRKLSEYLAVRKVPVTACVATEYGETLLTETEYLKVHAGRMDEAAMGQFFEEQKTELVVDATHPYAAVVSENVAAACKKAGVEYLRLIRESSTSETEDAVLVDSVDEAVNFLKETEGNILATTGSKELFKYTVIPNYESRVFARVLSTAEVASACEKLGFVGRNLICMQGPFSVEMNLAMLREYKISYLVTKESGIAGGYPQKCEAAAMAGVGLVVQNTLMVRITQSASTILIAMLLNSLVGIVIFVTMLLLRQGVAGFQELALSVKWWTLIPGLLGSFFVFASISGYQNVGAATTIAVLVASQLVGGLIMDLVRAHGVPVRALIGPLCGAVMLVVGAWLVARRQF